jgi:hypothetical protein
MFLDLPDPDPDPLVRGTDPNPAPDPSLPEVGSESGAASGSVSQRYGSGSVNKDFLKFVSLGTLRIIKNICKLMRML